MTVHRSALHLGLALLLAASWLLAVARPATAACHVAGFVENAVSGDESVGSAVLIVELQGRVGSCAGTVDVTTVDGTATAGSDYEAVTRTLRFETDDDRVETVDLVLLDDTESEGAETFTVELSNPTGGISGTGGPATVTIVDDDGDDADATIPPADATIPPADATIPPADADAQTPAAADTPPLVEGVQTLPVTEERDPLLVIVVALAVIGGAAFLGRRGRAG
ncbi:MAG: hypothetical protein ACI9AD_001017 [Nitriliruptoraceae bacterium]|jgi:hypothetical protein